MLMELFSLEGKYVLLLHSVQMSSRAHSTGEETIIKKDIGLVWPNQKHSFYAHHKSLR